jgi:hypothetical protein
MAAKVSIEAAIEKIQAANSVANKAPNLLAAAESMADNSELMIQRIAEGDLTNALAQSSAFSDSMKGLGLALLPLDLTIVLRQ